MHRRTRNAQLTTCLLVSTLTSTLLPLAAPLASASPSDSGENPAVRIEKLKGEIENFKVETDSTIALINENQEKTRCLDNVYSGLKSLTHQLDTIGPRNRVSPLAVRTRDLIKKHESFFDMLRDFSKQNQLLTENPDLTEQKESDHRPLNIDKISESIAEINKTFRQQATDEHLFLVELTATLRHLQRAGAAAKVGLESTKRCAPHLIEEQNHLIELGLKVLNELEKARAIIAELQLKRSRIIGSLTSASQLMLASKIAQNSGQMADDIVARLNASLADLSLRNEIERWWFTESVESGPARGHLWGKKENAIKAIESLRLALAQCDALIARAHEVAAMSSSSGQRENNTALSHLEVTLYQRRAALSRWLHDALQATTTSKVQGN